MKIAHEAIGPAITFTAWFAAMVYVANRTRGSVSFVEWLAVMGCLVMVQLLLDLHTPHLGDLVIVALHVAAAIVIALRKRKARRAARPGALGESEGD